MTNILLKRAIKKQSLPYQGLADRLDMYILTIKRQLNGKEISMSKLLALCDAANVTFSKIWQQVEQHKTRHTCFTKEQDLAFIITHIYTNYIKYVIILNGS